MDIPIFYQQELSSDFITLSEDTSRHVVQVLRMQGKEKLQLTDGAGSLITAEIVDAHKKKATVRVTDKTFIPAKNLKVSIAIALLKSSARFEWFLEKATEIGATEIYPLLSERTEKQHFRPERMNQVLIAAMMQSKQVWLPVLHQPTMIDQIVTRSLYETKLIAHCIDELRNPITEFTKRPSVQILIGPEGDFTKDEINFAVANNYQPVTFGENRLRTETAGVVAASILCL